MERVEHSRCPLCDSAEIALRLNLADHSISKEEFDVFACNDCGFLFTQNPPPASSAGKYYQAEAYVSHSDTKEGVVNKIYHVVRDFMLKKKFKMIEGFAIGKTILDVGSGTGYFLNFMRNNGYDTLGIEIDDNAREYGKKKFGLNILPQSDLVNDSITKQFHVISLWHVLEHLYDPEQYIQRFKNLLMGGGHLVIAVPNPDSCDARYYGEYWAAYDVPRHLWHFTPKTLNQLTAKYGFELVKMKRLPFDPFYNSMLSQQYKSGGNGVVLGGLQGGISWLNSLLNIKKSSSIVYVLRKGR